MIPEAVQAWLEEQGHGTIVSTRSVSGGCINRGKIISTESGDSFFLKTNPGAPEDMFAKEVAGLEALRQDDGPVVPQPYLHGREFLLMEDLAPAPRCDDYWPLFGRRLAALHNHTNARFGFSDDNYIGSTPQPNPWTEDGYDFFTEHRLIYQGRLARERGLLSQGDLNRLERLASRLPELVPAQPASLLHGDLWSGNATTDEHGQPAIIDPAAHYGWAEAELAMTTLFGSFSSAFYRAYEKVRPLEPGYRDRFPLYNLYHLLNHLNLFGRSYLSRVQSILRKFS